MADILLEIIRALLLLVIIVSLHRQSKDHRFSDAKGLSLLSYGFLLVFLGTIFDITDNFESLNRFIIIGDTPTQAFFEKIFGYLFGFLLIAMGISTWLPQISKHQASLREKLNELEQEKKELIGIIPICMHCKEIRDDKGAWNKLESYIQSHSEAEFSHSICENCLEKYYPEDEEFADKQ